MVNRFYLFLAMVVTGLALASCGGGANNAALDTMPAADNPAVTGVAPGASNLGTADQSPALGELAPGSDKNTDQWIPDPPGYYTATAGATFIDGVDYLFKLLTDNKGNYLWVLILTNDSGQPKTIYYGNNVRRYTFRIDQNGVMLWNSNSFVPQQPAGTLVLPPYGSKVYSLPWNGTDNHGHSIFGNVTATAIHRELHNIVSMSGFAWLNGVTGEFVYSEWPMFGMGPQHTHRSMYNGPQNNNVSWSYSLHPSPSSTVGSSPAIGMDGAIYAGSGNYFYSFNPDGTLRWSNVDFTGWYISSPAVGPDGTIYVGFEGFRLKAFRPNGVLYWSFPTSGEVVCSPVIGKDGTIYIVTLNGVVTAVKPDGTLKWTYNTGFGAGWSSPVLGTDGTVYLGTTGGGKVLAINSFGSLLWSFATGGPVYSSPAVGSDGTIYVGSDDFKVYAINPNGSLKWTYTTLGPVRSSPAIGADGTIYVGCEGFGYVYSINQWGYSSWQFSVGSPVSSSPSIGADGTIYFGADNDMVYALYSWGISKWSFLTGADVDSSPAIGKNGNLYIVSDDNKLYAFGS